jgi:hypothetical protein
MSIFKVLVQLNNEKRGRTQIYVKRGHNHDEMNKRDMKHFRVVAIIM